MTDNLTGLMWLKDANCFGYMTWQGALDKVADLNANPGRYTCGGYTGTYTDWTLPNVNELESLVNAEEGNSATWLSGQGFVNVQSGYYWSSTTNAEVTDNAWVVHMDYGYVLVPNGHKSFNYYVWPVRAGQSGSLVHLDIKANGSDGPITVSSSTPVAIDISLDPGDRDGENADWWIAVNTPFAPPGDWYTFVYPTGWLPGVNLCAQAGLFDLAPFEVLNMALPVGTYTFYFAVDDPDGAATGTWWGLDSVEVNVN